MREYASPDDYKEYDGIEVDETILLRFLKRANREIDLLIGDYDYDNLSDENKKRIKYATCAQVEFLIERGETASTIGGDAGSVSIGSYSESTYAAYGSKQNHREKRYASAVKDYLAPLGVFYGGVDCV